ncbi:hypothetical protein Tsp_08743 [Trichinella spiralis]|uniref:hypothetical protein n=1 Tax=Trichinella spiralis TaxID=6334 RepID=UPI0001EFE2F5|nr:hypothetical protein Tsp_08743 [Trichinella spiralis]
MLSTVVSKLAEIQFNRSIYEVTSLSCRITLDCLNLAIITFTNRNNPTLFQFFTISLEIRNQATWYQAHCCFLIFSYILTLFFEKNGIFENIEISWAIDFAVFAFWVKNCYLCCNHNVKVKRFSITVAPINGLKLNIISMLTFPEICYYAISDIIKSDALHKRVPIFVFILR